MNEETQIKMELGTELPSGAVPFSLDSDTAVRLGRRTRKRRRLLAVGGSALSVVAVTALVLAMLSPGSVIGADEATDDRKKAVDDGIPELDPNKEYDWMPSFMQTEVTAISEEYGDAFWDHMDKEFPEAEPDYTQYNAEGQAQARPTRNPPPLSRDEMQLNELDDSGEAETIYSVPVYTFMYEIEEVPNGSTFRGDLGFQFGDGVPNFVTVDVLPKNGYRVGSQDLFDLATCTEGYSGKQFSFDCAVTEAVGPDGEMVQNVKADTFEDGKLIDTSNTTILYREDGSAVVVRDHLRGRHGGSDDDEGKNIEGVEPALSFEDLLGIAAALPDKPVE